MYLYYNHLDESDLEGTSPSTSKLNTSTGSSGKKERHFWQYNVQAKGPKGQKITFETTIDDPHVLNDIVDPVFSGEVQLQGIKHRYFNFTKVFFEKIVCKKPKFNFFLVKADFGLTRKIEF